MKRIIILTVILLFTFLLQSAFAVDKAKLRWLRDKPIIDSIVINGNHYITKSEIKDGVERLEVQLAAIIVTGKVTDENNEDLPGVNVLIKGTTQGTVTDVEGNFSLEVPDENAILVFSSVGYLSVEFTVGDRTVFDLAMAPDITALEEVVVVGYGTQEKRNVSGSIVSIDSKVLEQVQSPSFDAALQGRVPGV